MGKDCPLLRYLRLPRHDRFKLEQRFAGVVDKFFEGQQDDPLWEKRAQGRHVKWVHAFAANPGWDARSIVELFSGAAYTDELAAEVGPIVAASCGTGNLNSTHSKSGDVLEVKVPSRGHETNPKLQRGMRNFVRQCCSGGLPLPGLEAECEQDLGYGGPKGKRTPRQSAPVAVIQDNLYQPCRLCGADIFENIKDAADNGQGPHRRGAAHHRAALLDELRRHLGDAVALAEAVADAVVTVLSYGDRGTAFLFGGLVEPRMHRRKYRPQFAAGASSGGFTAPKRRYRLTQRLIAHKCVQVCAIIYLASVL